MMAVAREAMPVTSAAVSAMSARDASSQRLTGPVLPVICIVFLIYPFVPGLPGVLRESTGWNEEVPAPYGGRKQLALWLTHRVLERRAERTDAPAAADGTRFPNETREHRA